MGIQSHLEQTIADRVGEEVRNAGRHLRDGLGQGWDAYASGWFPRDADGNVDWSAFRAKEAPELRRIGEDFGDMFDGWLRDFERMTGSWR